MNVKWTSTDVVRIANAKERFAPVILWIGVMPTSLSGEDGVAVACKCRELLGEYDINDVEVEIRESVVTRSAASAGPKLLRPASLVFTHDPIVEVRESLTTTLGLPICAQPTPWAEGTGGFFIAEGGNTKRILLVTTRHVVFPPDECQNTHFKHNNNNQPRHNVTLFGDAAFKTYLESIKEDIRDQAVIAEYQERRFKGVEGKNDTAAQNVMKNSQYKLTKAMEATEELNAFYEDVSTHWATPESRLLGHVILSPPIGSSHGYNEDWAVIEVDSSKVDASNFIGNAIGLGTRIPVDKFTMMIDPNFQNAPSFEYPVDHLLRLNGTISDDEMRRPTALDQNGDPCLMVMKRGNSTGLTIGRANNIFSYARICDDDGHAATAKEWAILPFDSKSGDFSAKGDSGSVVVDGLGRIGGLLTGGSGTTSSSDITYATPINFLLKRMQANGLNIRPECILE